MVSRAPSLQTRTGFGLIEALAALVIISMVLIPVMGLQTHLLSSLFHFTQDAHLWVRAHEFKEHARQQLAHDVAKDRFDQEIPDKNMRMSYRLEPIKDPHFKGLTGLYTETVSVRQGAVELLRFSTIYYDPERKPHREAS